MQRLLAHDDGLFAKGQKHRRAALKNAGVPVEMHLYARGGHAFGLRPTELPVKDWPRLVEVWLRTIGMTAE